MPSTGSAVVTDSSRVVAKSKPDLEAEEDEFVKSLAPEDWTLITAELNSRNVRSQSTVRVIFYKIRTLGGKAHKDLCDDAYTPPEIDGGDGDPFRVSAILDDASGSHWVGSKDDLTTIL
ncbi:hypothetical protein Pelo_2223 [Pelomyxa schiedti]|nr:hypothetical protein Pelo_2223 [Pelomyxa schiedti]